MKEAFLQLVMIFGAAGIFIIGLLSALWPINDKETSTTHRISTIFMTIVFVVLWINIFS